MSGQNNAELLELEKLSEKMYTSANMMERQQATEFLHGLQTSAEYITKVQMVLFQSNNAYALMMAGKTMLKLITTFWNSFNQEQILSLYNSLFQFIFSKGLSVPLYISSSISQSLSRVIKLGWLQVEQIRNQTMSNIKSSMAMGSKPCLLALKLLTELNQEMNSVKGTMRNSIHRKISTGFRDKLLKDIFQLSLMTMKALLNNNTPMSKSESEAIRKEVIVLAMSCLNFDFVGTNPYESEQEASVTHIPSEWKSIFEDPQMVQLFYGMFSSAQTNQEAKDALECVRLAVSARRTLFSVDKRAGFFTAVMGGLVEILKTQTGSEGKVSQDRDVHHNLCRLILQTKRNYRLSEILGTPNHLEWLNLVAQFTVDTSNFFTWSFKGVHYLLGFWSRLVSDLPHLKIQTNIGSTFFHQYIPVLVNAVISNRIKAANECDQDDQMAELFDDGNMHVELVHVPILYRFRYDMSLSMLQNQFYPLIGTYKQMLQQIEGNYNDQSGGLLLKHECQLANYVFHLGSIIGHQKIRNKAFVEFDATICCWFFELLSVVEVRLTNNSIRQNVSKNRYLELSILYWFDQFRDAYLGLTPRTAYNHTRVEDKNTLFGRLSHMLNNPMDQATILNIIVNKIIVNLAHWTDDEHVLKSSNHLLNQLATQHTTAAEITNSDAIVNLLRVHGPKNLPFLGLHRFSELHKTFYHTLSRLAFKAQHIANFDLFMAPIEEVLVNFSQMSNLRTDIVANHGANVCTYLTGVLQGAFTARSYIRFFNWFSPRFMPLILRLLETWWDNPVVTKPILDFYSELMSNKSSRIDFGHHSSSTIVLFHECSKVVNTYGSRIQNMKVDQKKAQDSSADSVYDYKLKGTSSCLKMLTLVMSSTYVNFGIMKFYKDKSLSVALNSGIQLIIGLPLRDALEYDDISKNYFGFLEVLFRNHCDMVENLQTKILFGLVSSLHEGVTGFNRPNSCIAASALDNLFTYQVTQRKKQSTQQRNNDQSTMEQHFSQSAGLLLVTDILNSMMNMIIFDRAGNQWSLARAICSLIICHQQAFQYYKNQLIQKQPQEVHQRVQVCFQALMEGVTEDPSSANKDMFSSNITKFSTAIAEFCVRPDFN